MLSKAVAVVILVVFVLVLISCAAKDSRPVRRQGRCRAIPNSHMVNEEGKRCRMLLCAHQVVTVCQPDGSEVEASVSDREIRISVAAASENDELSLEPGVFAFINKVFTLMRKNEKVGLFKYFDYSLAFFVNVVIEKMVETIFDLVFRLKEVDDDPKKPEVVMPAMIPTMMDGTMVVGAVNPPPSKWLVRSS